MWCPAAPPQEDLKKRGQQSLYALLSLHFCCRSAVLPKIPKNLDLINS